MRAIRRSPPAVLAALVVLALPAVVAATPATLTLTSTPPVVVNGTPAQLAGTVIGGDGLPLAGATLSLQAQRYDEIGFTPVGPATPIITGAVGQFAVAVSPSFTTIYRVAFAGDGTGATGTEYGAAEFLVRVRPRITTDFPKMGLWVGKATTLRGAVRPALTHEGAQVTIEQRVGGVWQAYRAVTLSETGTFSATWKPDSPGFKYLRVTMAGDAGHAVMTTTSRRLVVNNLNPHRIPITYAHYIVIDHSEYHLYYYEYGRVIKKWDCVLGAPATPTPYGHFRINSRVVGPGYGMGPYFLGYYGAIGIHGTSAPWLIKRFPRAFSHGCARLSNSRITWLFPRVPIGTPVWNIR